MPEKPFSLTREERLRSRKIIETVFEEGNSLSCFPFRLIWIAKRPLEDEKPVQAAFTVSKKKLRQAVKRNLLKRRMREAYRKNKIILYACMQEKNLHCSLIILYFHNEILNYAYLETSLVKALYQLVQSLEKGTLSPVYRSD